MVESVYNFKVDLEELESQRKKLNGQMSIK